MCNCQTDQKCEVEAPKYDPQTWEVVNIQACMVYAPLQEVGFTHHVDVLELVPRLHRQPGVEAQRWESTEDILVQRLIVAVDVVGDLHRVAEHGGYSTLPENGGMWRRRRRGCAQCIPTDM